MAPSFNLFLMVLLTCVLHTNGCYTSIISFGDSLADTGNAKQLAIYENVELHSMFFPYGETYFHNPTGRYSNGRLIVDFVAESLGLPFIPPYVGSDGNGVDFGQGLNYAVASATTLEASFHEARGYSVPTNASLQVQLEWFKQSLSSMCSTLSVKMPIEFTVEQDREHFAEFQFLPDVYNDEAYHGNDEIYILSADGYRFRVELGRAQCGPWYLAGPKWTAFCNRCLNEDVELLHFVEEGEDCFYVTGYLENGHEVGGYAGIRSGISRFKSIVLPNPRLPQALPAEILPGLEERDEIILEADGQEYHCDVRRVPVLQEMASFKYQLLRDAWNTLVDDLGLEAGITVVFTKSPGHRIWVDAFEDDGSMITEFVFKGTTTLSRVQLPLEWHEEKDDRMKHICFWPFHRDHFGEYDRVFYKEYAQIQCYNRLAIPSYFLDRHPMHMYNKVLIILGNYKVEMEIRTQPHRENPSRTNHVNVHGPWRELADVNDFPYTKVIRFRYISIGEDLEAPAGQNPHFPIFHIC